MLNIGEYLIPPRTLGDWYSGDWDGWQYYDFDLTDVHTLGNLLGEDQVGISFYFWNDEMIKYSEGASVDDIVLWKCENSEGCVNDGTSESTLNINTWYKTKHMSIRR